MKFKLVPVFCRLVQVEFEDGLTTGFLDMRHEADVRLCGIIQALIDSGFEHEVSHGSNERLMRIIEESAR